MPENNFIYQDHFILAEQQEVSHDTSLSGNGTVNSPLGADVDALKRLLGIDETVLFSGTGASGNFSESLSNFKKVEFHLSDDTFIRQVATLYPEDAVGGAYIIGAASVWQPNTSPVRVLSVSGNMNSFNKSNASYQWWSKADGGYSTFSTTPVVVVGIGRKQ